MSKITARLLAFEVQKLAPGQCKLFSYFVLSEIQSPHDWNPVEWIMESIIGSSYEYTYHMTANRDVEFCRLAKPLEGGLRTYMSTDRRHLFKLRPDGLWERNNVK